MANLFGEDNVVPIKPKKEKGDVARAIDAFHVAFVARHGFKPHIRGGKDGTHFKELIATWGADVVIGELIPEFFRTTHPRVLRSDYSVGALYACAQHLRMVNIDERTASNLDAARRATERR
jgi:hypothetical protein